MGLSVELRMQVHTEQKKSAVSAEQNVGHK